MTKHELAKAYEPNAVEAKWRAYWEEHDSFRTDAASPREPFVILIPPPNVTGVLHMGHILNYTIQDVVIRWRRMQGREALWLPGMDHAGIATQNMVEKALRAEGKSRFDLGREAFVERVWEWKERHGGKILEQFRRLGASFDAHRMRFTLDPGYSRAVAEVFVALYRKGLLYRGNYIASWCPRCRTVLSDEEVEHEERTGALYHIRYPLEGGSGHLVVATTRPETMLGDTAVAIHPEHEATRHLSGKRAVLPLVGRVLPIVEDERVDPEFGTGCVKVTPAHDPVDFEIGRAHELDQVRIFEEDATIRPGFGRYSGMKREAARRAVLEDLEAEGLLVKTDDHKHAVGRCYRCATDVEPWLSMQWFVSMKPLAAPAIDAVRGGRVRLFPDRWEKVYFHWMENVRDWCVSRQLWWGHRIPAWYCGCGEVIVEAAAPSKCPKCGSADLRQDEDVLDTWFSSWLWPFATLGWPEKTPELARFFPSHLLATGPDIIFFWVARMIVSSLEFMGEVPFREVYFHGIVRDAKGRKLSKSLGNSPDPVEVLDRFGGDAVRFATVLTTPPGQDQLYSDEKIETGKRFANKVWNATRFVLPYVDGAPDSPPDAARLPLAERWILSRLTAVQAETTAHLEATRLNEASYAVYDFLWHSYCDWYLEISKPALLDGGGAPAARAVLLHVLREGIRLLSPFMPHRSEEIGSHLGLGEPCVSLCRWNDGSGGFRDEDAEREMAAVQEVVTAVRTLRSEVSVPPREEVRVLVRFLDDGARRPVERNAEMVRRLARVRELELDPESRPKGAIAEVTGSVEVFLPLQGIADLEKERTRLAREADRLAGELDRIGRKLMNHEYVSRAPADVVEKDRDRERRFAEMLERLRENLRALSD